MLNNTHYVPGLPKCQIDVLKTKVKNQNQNKTQLGLPLNLTSVVSVIILGPARN